MKANYHTHTPRCHHASGSEESYIQAALNAGFDVLGFADHAPFPFRSGYVSPMRMTMDEFPGYLSTLQALRGQYQDRLRLHIGLEAEYFPAYEDHLRRMREESVEYLILGQHYLISEEISPYVPDDCLRDDGIRRYAEAVTAGIRTGLFAYVAHPDLMMRSRRESQFDAACEEATDMICQAALEMGIPLEYNLLGVVNQLGGLMCGYPCAPFWQRAARWKPAVILGVDAHSPQHLLREDVWELGIRQLKKAGLRPIDRLNLD